MNDALREYHNDTGEWQGAFRYGHLDLVAHRYAVDACEGIDELVVTGLDRLATVPDRKYCLSYEVPNTPDANHFFGRNAQGDGARILLGPFQDLDYQARLTQLLAQSRPVYHSLGAAEDSELFNVIETTLGVPITLASYGPTAADKRALTRV